MQPPLSSFNPYTFDPDEKDPRLSQKGVKVAFGSFARLYTEDSLIAALGVPLTRKAFRAFLRTLSVPTISIGRTRLVDGFSFFLALRAILRIGQRDFLAPGSYDKARVRMGHRRGPHVTSLDLGYLKRDYKLIASELLYAQRANRLRISDKALGEAASTALTRMLAIGFLHAPLKGQDAAARSVLRELATDGTLPPWTLDDATPTPPIPDLPSFPTPPSTG